MTEEKKAELRQLLIDNRAQLMEALRAAEQAGWDTQVQADGEQWTALQMLRHLQDAHKGLTGQLQRMLAGQPTVPPEFDVNRWNASVQRKTTEMTAEAALESLAASHEALLDIVAALRPEDFQQRGWSSARQREVSLEEFVQVIGLHEGMHATEIAEAAAQRARS